MSRMDANKDGKVTKDEARGPMAQRFDQMDKDGDGAITKEEVEKHFANMRGGGGGSGKGGGNRPSPDR